jgi:3-phenylpropionate/trans-cinnamate dioxygenase ferredoxin subunit
MGTFVEAAKTGEFQDGAMKEVGLQGKKILLAKIKDKYYAATGRCTHFGGNLSRGTLEGTVVTCPLHGSQFDLTDGHVVRWLRSSGPPSKAGKQLNTYKVKVESDKILVEI